MATIATPQKRARSGRRRWMIGGGVLVVLIILGALIIPRLGSTAATQQASGWQTAPAELGTIDASINATGSVEPEAQAELRFSANGTVTEVLVKAGDKVEKGQALARIDDKLLRIALDRAQTDLRQAQTDYQKLINGPTAEEITGAKARIAQAEAQFRQVSGSVTRADVAAARAKLDAAKARLATLQSGFTDLRNSQDAVQKAQTQLTSRRDELSQAKTNAQIALDQAANQLNQAQTSYSTAKQNWEYVQETGADPSNPTITGPDGKKVKNKLNETQRQQYYNAFVQAETALRNAESDVEKARVNYDQARQAEVTGVQSAEQEVQSAQTQLDQQRAGGANSQLAGARAEVEAAQAELNKLTGADRSGSIAQAQAGVDIAQADLAKLTAKPTDADLATAQNAIDRAKLALQQAQFDLDDATLKAPFSGTIARMDLRVGESSAGSVSASSSSSSSSGVVVVADLSTFHVKVPVDELDVAQLKNGQPVRITLDALPGKELNGKVTSIEPLATKSSQGTTTYQVTVALDANEQAVLPGMTAAVEIVTVSKKDVVLVPRRAVQTENGKNYVLVATGGQPDPRTGAPASQRRDVKLGLSNSERIEITDGLKAGEKVLVQDVVSTFNPVNQGGPNQ